MKSKYILLILTLTTFLASLASVAKNISSDDEFRDQYFASFSDCVGDSWNSPEADRWENCNNSILEKYWEEIPECAELELRVFASQEFSQYLDKSGDLMGANAENKADEKFETLRKLTEHTKALSELQNKLKNYNESAVNHRVKSVPKDQYKPDLWVIARVDIQKKCKGTRNNFNRALLVHSILSVDPQQARK